MVKLPVLRQTHQSQRFARQRDDSRHDIDAAALASRLRRALEGEVRFDDGSRALYATDASNYRQVPIGVVVPRHVDDIVATVDLCRQFGAPILSRGGGTSLAGQCCNVAVVMDTSKYLHHVKHIDQRRRLAVVEPGCVLDHLRAQARQYGLTFAPDPATHAWCTLGGMIGNNAAGVHSLIAKNHGLGMRTSDNLHELDVLTYDGTRMRVGETSADDLQRIIQTGGRRGQIYEQMKALIDRDAEAIRVDFPKLERRVSGYNLDDLLPERGFHVARALSGSEGTLATILEATVILVPQPRELVLLILGYPDILSAADHLHDILPFNPTGLEGVDDVLVEFERKRGAHDEHLPKLPEGNGFLFVEFGAESKDEAREQARRCMAALKKQPRPPGMRLFDDDAEQSAMWSIRDESLGSTAFVRGMPDTWEGWEDSAVPVKDIGPYLHDLRDLFRRFGYKVSTYGHFSQGVVHCRIPFDFYTRHGLEEFRRFLDEATDLCKRYGGSFSGEHGDGQARAMYLPKLFGPRLVESFRQFKRIWDPQGKMNPSKVVDAHTVTDNLRLGPDYNPPQPQTHFHFPDSDHSFSRAVLRCVGVGKCRREVGGTMCPSYMVTREEKHSTRGRARLLWEMLNGDVLTDGWRSKPVKDALDLCLACKGCRNDCPVNVDMATYKAEFRAHHYAGRLRPRHMYAFGWVQYWAKLAGVAPALANIVGQTPGVSHLLKAIGGIEQRRRLPTFAPRTFRQWFARRPVRTPRGRPVVLYIDTFNNHFYPEVGQAAVEVLEDAGFDVIVPKQKLCCGRPLYDYGFLGMARRQLEDNLAALRPFIREDVPIVLLEPSCWAVFADELVNLLPAEKDAHRLKASTYLLGEFLNQHAPQYRVPQLRRRAMLHKHCHEKSLLKHTTIGQTHVLRRMGLDLHEPTTGCCGMAGAFGYEPGEAYDVSVACAEHVLLKEIDKLGPEDLVITDGFSCREQISQLSSRHALHLAQVMQLALRHGPDGPQGLPERQVVQSRRRDHRIGATGAVLSIAGLAAAAGLAYTLLKSSPAPAHRPARETSVHVKAGDR